jgi:hypothetical protein
MPRNFQESGQFVFFPGCALKLRCNLREQLALDHFSNGQERHVIHSCAIVLVQVAEFQAELVLEFQAQPCEDPVLVESPDGLAFVFIETKENFIKHHHRPFLLVPDRDLGSQHMPDPDSKIGLPLTDALLEAGPIEQNDAFRTIHALVLLPRSEFPHLEIGIGKIQYARPKGLVGVEIENHRRSDQNAGSLGILEIEPWLDFKVIVPVSFFIQRSPKGVQAPELTTMDQALGKSREGKQEKEERTQEIRGVHDGQTTT